MGCEAPGARRILFRSEIRARTERGEPTAPYTKLGTFKLPNQNLRHIIHKADTIGGSAPALPEDPGLINAPAGKCTCRHRRAIAHPGGLLTQRALMRYSLSAHFISVSVRHRVDSVQAPLSEPDDPNTLHGRDSRLQSGNRRNVMQPGSIKAPGFSANPRLLSEQPSQSETGGRPRCDRTLVIATRPAETPR